jgi:pilus assembly protein CpaE
MISQLGIRSMQRVAIVDPNEASRESLRALLLGVDFVWLEAECARYEYFFDVIQSSPPDLVIVNLDSDKSKSANLVSHIAARYPKMPIVTISSDSNVLLQSLQRGAKFFLTAPNIALEDLVTTLRRALNEIGVTDSNNTPLPGMQNNKPITSCTIISLLGSRGGVGTTSIAVNLAATLAADPNNQVALIDLDLALGDADIAIELPANDGLSLSDLARNIERLDMNYLKRALIRHPETNLSILRHPLEITDIGGIHEGHVERIINLLKVSYTHLVLDLSKALLPTDLMALRLSDVVLLTSQLELSSLRNVVRLVHSLSEEPTLGDKLRILMNRVGSDYMEAGISIQKAEEVIGKPIFWQLPNDSKPMMASRVAGMPLVKSAPKCKVQLSLFGLANTISGKAVVTEAPKKKGWFS